MFFIQAHITVETNLSLPDISKLVSHALEIPEMCIDKSGRFEGAVAYTTSCFGIEVGMCRTDEDPPNTFHLFLFSDIDAFDFDGSEKEVDGTDYILRLLHKVGIRGDRRDPKLLYGEEE